MKGRLTSSWQQVPMAFAMAAWHLLTMAESETYADVTICLSNTGWKAAQPKADTIKSLEELRLTPAGQQILARFKIDGVVPFQESYLDSVHKLGASHGQWRKEVQS